MSLNAPRYLHAITLAADKFIVSGGRSERDMFEVISDDVEVMETSTCAWHSGGVMPSGARVGHSMTTRKDTAEVIVAGGCAFDHALVDVDIFDAATENWQKAESTKTPRCRHAAIGLEDGRIAVIGSLNLATVVNGVEIYDPSTGHWTDASPMVQARYDHAVVALPDGRLLVVGGTDNATEGEDGALRSTELYNPGKDEWQPGPAMRDGRRWPVVAVLSDGVYVAGGSNATGQLQTVERLKWSDLGISKPGPDPNGSGGCSCAVVDPVDLKIGTNLMFAVAILCLAALRGRQPRRRRRS